MNKYIGHYTQLYGVREVRAVGGKEDGMRLLEVYNGKGISFIISLDRCGDIPYLFFKSNSMAYIAPCGLVAPQYYDNRGIGFLKSFTAGFLTTCGLTAVGSPCSDNGEELPLHGNISHVPCEMYSYEIDENSIRIKTLVRDASLFSHKLIIEREYVCSLTENTLILNDKITNIDCKETPYMILYHCNMGYPLLNENSVLKINSKNVLPRDEHAKKDIDIWDKMIAPQNDFTEQCYYHSFEGEPQISLYNPDINTKMEMRYSYDSLDYFTQWKMMGKSEYVLGLEPGNCHPEGRDVMRKEGKLKFLKPGESVKNQLCFMFESV